MIQIDGEGGEHDDRIFACDFNFVVQIHLLISIEVGQVKLILLVGNFKMPP